MVEDYEFLYYYAPSLGSSEIKNLRCLRITRDLEIHALYKEFVTVNFKTNSSDTEDFSQKVIKGEKVAYPSIPVKAGKGFLAWYLDEELTEEYDFDSEVNKKFNLYAKYSDECHTVKLDLGDDYGDPDYQKEFVVGDGHKFKKPAKPVSNDKYDFQKWYLDPAFNNAVIWGKDKEFEISSNITFYAKFTALWTDISFYSNEETQYGTMRLEYGEGLKFEDVPAYHDPLDETKTIWDFVYNYMDCDKDLNFTEGNIFTRGNYTFYSVISDKITFRFYSSVDPNLLLNEQKVGFGESAYYPNPNNPDHINPLLIEGENIFYWAFETAEENEYYHQKLKNQSPIYRPYGYDVESNDSIIVNLRAISNTEAHQVSFEFSDEVIEKPIEPINVCYGELLYEKLIEATKAAGVSYSSSDSVDFLLNGNPVRFKETRMPNNNITVKVIAPRVRMVKVLAYDGVKYNTIHSGSVPFGATIEDIVKEEKYYDPRQVLQDIYFKGEFYKEGEPEVILDKNHVLESNTTYYARAHATKLYINLNIKAEAKSETIPGLDIYEQFYFNLINHGRDYEATPDDLLKLSKKLYGNPSLYNILDFSVRGEAKEKLSLKEYKADEIFKAGQYIQIYIKVESPVRKLILKPGKGALEEETDYAIYYEGEVVSEYSQVNPKDASGDYEFLKWTDGENDIILSQYEISKGVEDIVLEGIWRYKYTKITLHKGTQKASFYVNKKLTYDFCYMVATSDISDSFKAYTKINLVDSLGKNGKAIQKYQGYKFVSRKTQKEYYNGSKEIYAPDYKEEESFDVIETDIYKIQVEYVHVSIRKEICYPGNKALKDIKWENVFGPDITADVINLGYFYALIGAADPIYRSFPSEDFATIENIYILCKQIEPRLDNMTSIFFEDKKNN